MIHELIWVIRWTEELKLSWNGSVSPWMKVVDLMGLRPSEGADDVLPLYYDVDIIARYWKRRPVAVVQRVFQLLSIAGGFISGIALDIAQEKVEENSVKRAIQLRDIVTSLAWPCTDCLPIVYHAVQVHC